MQRFIFASAILTLLGVLALGPGGALAMGSSSSSAGKSAGGDDWSMAKKAIADKDYGAAEPLLKKAVMADPKNADALNYLGYINGREGRNSEALAYYKQALAVKPDHRGANEYLGELYLKMGNLAGAEERLKVLDEACFFGCTELDLLKTAVRTFKETGKFSSAKGL
jgi:tetratricopeptide (TPR) repeat protein